MILYQFGIKRGSLNLSKIERRDRGANLQGLGANLQGLGANLYGSGANLQVTLSSSPEHQSITKQERLIP